MTTIPVRLQPRNLRYILIGGALSYAVAWSIAGLHYAGLSDAKVAAIGVPLAIMAIIFLFRDIRASTGKGTLTIENGEILVTRGRTFFRVSTHLLHAEYGCFVHMLNAESSSRKDWNGPAIRLASPKSRKKLTILSTWQSISSSNSKTSPESPLWQNSRNGFQVRVGDIFLEGQAFDRLQEVLAIGDVGSP